MGWYEFLPFGVRTRYQMMRCACRLRIMFLLTSWLLTDVTVVVLVRHCSNQLSPIFPASVLPSFFCICEVVCVNGYGDTDETNYSIQKRVGVVYLFCSIGLFLLQNIFIPPRTISSQSTILRILVYLSLVLVLLLLRSLLA